MKRVLILEDNNNTLECLEKIVKDIDRRNAVYSVCSVSDAYKCAMEKEINLFIVDIILDSKRPGDTSGLTFVEKIRQLDQYTFTPVIFVTSLEDSRLYTYEKLHCYRFIEKPFDIEQIKETVNECMRFPGRKPASQNLYFRKDGVIYAVDCRELIYAEAYNHRLYIHTDKRDCLEIPYFTIKKLLDMADSEEIIQCNRGCVLNKRYIDTIDFTNNTIRLKNGFGKVDIGIKYKRYLKDLFT